MWPATLRSHPHSAARKGTNDVSDELARHKKALRTDMRLRREAISPPELARLSAAAASFAQRLPEFQRASVIALYCPFRGELDPLPWIEGDLAAGRTFVLPRTDPDGRRLSFHLPSPTLAFDGHKGLAQALRDRLVPGPYGILEPTGEIVEDVDIDLVVVPALAYDHRGARLGYGGGFYDRWLALRRAAGHKPATAVGLGHRWQVLETLPTQDHDQPMEVIVTPSGTLRAAQSVR